MNVGMNARRAFLLLLFPGLLAAQSSSIPHAVTHDNLHPAGQLANGVLTLHLDIREANWTPDAEDGTALPVLAFGEEGQPPSIPGPLIRIPQGTTIHVTIKNPLFVTAFVHGLHTHPGKSEDAVKIPGNESKELTFVAGEPGTYYYWAATSADTTLDSRLTWDTLLTGAFIVDAPGEPVTDRILMIGLWYNMLVPVDFDRGFHEIPNINGKSWPHTTRLSYDMGDTVHWRVINGSVATHPMHLHGVHFQIDSEGDGEHDTIYSNAQQRMVVTESMDPGRTMAMTWKPSHPGNWLFHCHLENHFDGSIASAAAHVMGTGGETTGEEHHHEAMAGLVVGVNINPPATPTVVSEPKVKRRQLKIVVSQSKGASGTHRPIQVEIHEGANVTTTAQGSEVGPPLILHRGEPTEITVENRLDAPTAMHWHGMEIESYYDGVVGFGGNAQQSTPPIAPGDSFVVRMTPPRAGTFIYHTHWHDIEQLASGLYGPMIVLDPGETLDPEHDRVFVVSRQGADIFNAPLLMNGTTQPQVAALQAGTHYRFRFINITPSDDGDNVTLTAAGKPLSWTAYAKDGADLPEFFRKTGEAKLQFGAGETYDFQFTPEHAGDLELETSFISQHTKAQILVNEKK